MNFHGGDIYSYRGDLLDFSSNINPLGIPDSFRELLLLRLSDFTRYPDIDYLEVRKRIAEYLNICDTGYIIPGNGAVELIYKLVASSRAERVICLRPTFSEYGRAAEAAGVEFCDIPAFDADFNAVDVEMLISGIKPHSLVVICNPNNPTGTLIGKEAMKYLAAVLLKLDCKLVIDEAFIEFTDSYPENSMVDSVEEFTNTTIIRAATKFFGMPGIRLGYAVTADTAAIKAVRELMEPWNLNSAAVIAACSVFEDRKYINNTRCWIKTERKYFFEELGRFEKLKIYPSTANFHLLRIEDGNMTAAQLKENMAEHGVLIRTAEGFNGLSQFHFRLAVKDRNSNDIILRILGEEMDNT
ncbi:MAG TPA: threonine-phosphate decarboxylase [Clostridia bacterium]|nr:threonine-phosphate decarboxylase [Clostridia bacterium]